MRLIDDMLDVTRMRSGRLSMKPQALDLAVLARRVVEGLTQQAEAQGCELPVEAQAVDGAWTSSASSRY